MAESAKRGREEEEQLEEPPDPTDLTAKEARIRAHEPVSRFDRPSRNALKQFRNIQKAQRDRRKQDQLERASRRKPKKVERVSQKEMPEFPVVRLPVRERHPMELQRLREELEAAKRHGRENSKIGDANLHEQQARVLAEEEKTKDLQLQSYLTRFAAWRREFEMAIATKGESAGLGINSKPKDDIRSFVKVTEAQHMENVVRAMERRYYVEVLHEAVHVAPRNKLTEKPRKSTIVRSIVKQSAAAQPNSVCAKCGGSVLIDEHLASSSCSKCGMVGGIVHSNGVNFNDRQNYSKGTLPYEPLSHFKEFISRLQGVERTEIPEAVIDSVKTRCDMHRVDYKNDPTSLTYSRCRYFLQQEGFASRFENICQIIRRVTGIQPVTLSEQEVENLTLMFLEIEKCYSEYKGKRRNMLSYSYITYKSCQLLGITRALPFLPLFKDASNLSRADNIWKKMCSTLGYEFIESA